MVGIYIFLCEINEVRTRCLVDAIALEMRLSRFYLSFSLVEVSANLRNQYRSNDRRSRIYGNEKADHQQGKLDVKGVCIMFGTMQHSR